MGSGVMRVMPGDPVGTRLCSHLTFPNRLLTLCLLLCCAPPAQNCKSDVIPVDMVGNMTIAAAYYVGTRSVEVGLVACSKSGGGGQGQGLIVMCISTPPPQKTGEPMVFNCTTSGVNPSTWGDWSQVCLSSWRQYPLEKRVFRRLVGGFFPFFFLLGD